MQDLLPIAPFQLLIQPDIPKSPFEVDAEHPRHVPVTVHIKLASVDLDEASEDTEGYSTVKIIKRDASTEEYELEDILNGKVEDAENEFKEYVLLTLGNNPRKGLRPQCKLDLVILPEEDIQFIVSGPRSVYLSGSYVKHPFDTDFIDDTDELDELEEQKAHEEAYKAEEKKKQEKNTKQDKKKEHTKGKTEKATLLEGGVIFEDFTKGRGPQAKKGSKIGMRYVGKLKNGTIFDKNMSGKPFVFKLGYGEVIKGWDIGIQGMAVGGQRRIVIPAPYGYGKEGAEGIPPNSELTFDVKLISMK